MNDPATGRFLRADTEDRFWGKVAIPRDVVTACWEWRGGAFQNGYGQFAIDQAPKKAHRVSYALVRGQIPAGAVVRHDCDNRLCVNPMHLRTGTQQDNVDDRQARGRTAAGDRHWTRQNPEKAAAVARANLSKRRKPTPPRGEAHPSAKLRDSDVLAIRSAVAAGVKHRLVAAAFGLRKERISELLHKTWQHLKPTTKAPFSPTEAPIQ